MASAARRTSREAPAPLDPRIDVDAARAGRLRPADQAVIGQHVAHHQRHAPDVGPRHAGTGVQVDAQLIGVVEVVGAHRMRVEVDAAQVGDPRQRGAVARPPPRRRCGPMGRPAPRCSRTRGTDFGARFWKKASPVMPSTNRFSAIGRSRTPSRAPSATAMKYSTSSSLVMPASGKYTLSGLVIGDLEAVELERDRWVLWHGISLPCRRRSPQVEPIGPMFDRVIAFGTDRTTVDGWLQRYRLTRVARTSVMGLLDHDGPELRRLDGVLLDPVLRQRPAAGRGAAGRSSSVRGRPARHHPDLVRAEHAHRPGPDRRDDRRGHRARAAASPRGPRLPAVGRPGLLRRGEPRRQPRLQRRRAASSSCARSCSASC